MSPTDKPLVWIAGEVHSPPFSADARLKAGFLLRLLQQGETLSMPASRPMFEATGTGCHELRVIDSEERKTWRLVYWVDADAIYVLDVFAKKSRTTPGGVKKRCRERLQQLRRTLDGEREGR